MKKINIIFMVIFFAGMVTLTFTAGRIHDAGLPKVEVAKIASRGFSVMGTLEDGSIVENKLSGLALPVEALDNGVVFVVSEGELYGRVRYYAKKVNVQVGVEQGGFYYLKSGVVSGITKKSLVILNSTEPLHDGMEIYIK